MGMLDFVRDLPDSDGVVALLASFMRARGYAVRLAPPSNFPDWDIEATNPSKSNTLTFEVKNDELAEDTGNVGIEFECRGKPSGIVTTKSDYWVHRYDGRFHFILTTKLRRIVGDIAHVEVYGGDIGSGTRMYLIRKTKFVEVCDFVM